MTKYDLVSRFLGYQNKRDITNLPPGVLVAGSQNVLMNDGERVAVRGGYVLDGQASDAATPIRSAYDWQRHVGDQRHLRSLYDELQFRYVADDGTVTWRTVADGYGDAVDFNYAEFWNASEETDSLLFVNGTPYIHEWSGGVAVLSSATSSTLTKTGTETWGEEGFFTTGDRAVVIDGVQYAYTGGEDSTTLTGVTPSPVSSVFDQSQTSENVPIPFGQADAEDADQEQTTVTGPQAFGEDTTVSGNSAQVAQSFVPTASSVAAVQLYKETDTGVFTGEVTVRIVSDASGDPDTSDVLATYTFSNAEWAATANGAFTVIFSVPATVVPASTYWILLRCAGASTPNHPNLGINAAGGYASGEAKNFNTPDGWDGLAGADFYFKTITTLGENRVAQSFVPTQAAMAGVQLYKEADTGAFAGDVTVSVQADAAGSPSGTPIASVTIAFAAWDALSADAAFDAIFSSPAALTPSATYWVVVSASTASDSAYANIGIDSGGGYASGSLKYFNTPGGWSLVRTFDAYFQTIVSQSPLPGGEVVQQAVRSIFNSTIPTDLSNDLIATLYNQVYVGSLTNRQVYVSAVDSFTDFTFSSPREPGEGALLTLDSPPVGFVAQEDSMYVAAGKDQWYRTEFLTSSDLSYEDLSATRLKTTGQAAAMSQALIGKMKNYVFYVSNEPSLDTLGKVELIDTPQSLNLSDPIKADFDSYDFAGGCSFYWKNYLFVAVPADGIVRVFNVARALSAAGSSSAVSIDAGSALVGWEAPQVMPISRFSVIDGELYGHSSQVAESYRLFSGYSDDGHPIAAVAAFSYQNGGDRANSKSFDEFYNEGYITANTTLGLRINYNYLGSGGSVTTSVSGADPRAVQGTGGDGSLGKQSLGVRSLGGRGTSADQALPPKYRIIKTFPRTDCYEWQAVYSSNGTDQRWELLCWGPNATMSTSTNAPITE